MVKIAFTLLLVVCILTVTMGYGPNDSAEREDRRRHGDHHSSSTRSEGHTQTAGQTHQQQQGQPGNHQGASQQHHQQQGGRPDNQQHSFGQQQHQGGYKTHGY